MSRFSRVFARGSSVRFASAAIAAAMFAGLLTLPNTASAQGLLQSPSANLNTGTTPQGIAAADFARKGWTGLVIANSHQSGRRNPTSTITVYLGTGPNTYGTANTYTVCAGPTAVLATDINHDGYPDIIVACTGDATIDVLFNDKTGLFGTPTSYPVSSNPVALVAGDFAGKGYVDIASADSNGDVSVLLNTTGNGTFSSGHVSLTGNPTLSGIAAGDFNKDGSLDVAVSDSANNTVHVLTNNGSGTFAQHGTYSTGTGTKPSDIVAADFNQDGKIDVATSNAGKNTVSILLGKGDGSLTIPAITQTTGTDPIALVTTDVDSDGNPDVVVFDSPTNSPGQIDVLLGNGDGTLQIAQSNSEAFEPGTQATVADFNRDGKPDIGLAQQDNNVASVLLNNTLPTQYPDGRSFAAYNTLAAGLGNFADSVAVGDFNKDGDLDIAVSYMQDNDVQVLRGNGNGSFSAAGTYATGTQPYWIASGDLNGDGYPDLVTANTTLSSSTGTISVLLNKGAAGNGTFLPAVSYTVGAQPYQIAIGDLNGDGNPDLAVTNNAGNTVSILFGSGSGTFTVQSATLATCANPYGVAIGDFKHNGFPSVAVTCYASSQLEIFPNNGNGTFGSPFMYTVGNSINSLVPNPASIALGDFNRDGKLDIVVGNTTANNISFFAGNGDNSFQASVESPSLNFPDSIVAGDFNGDGILDIAGVAPIWNAVELTLGVGDGTFGTLQQRAAGQLAMQTVPWGLAAGDFNNDGKTDIVTANVDHVVNIANATGQWRYLAQFPANPSGNPSIGVLMNASAAAITVSTSPSPVPANNTDVTAKASVQPALSGTTPTGSIIFQDSTGSVLGTGPYPLNSGVATYGLGHLGSGTSYTFTSLYSGDSNYQPTTVSGSNGSFTVPGTPVTLSFNPSTVDLGGTFVATVTATGNTTTGSWPHGTATIYIDTGNGISTPIGTTGAFTQSGTHNGTTTITLTATAANNLPVGSYELYAVFNPSSGAYTQGSSSDVPLSVIPLPATPITLSLNPSSVHYGNTFVATVTATGNTTSGSYPQGTATIYIDNGGTPIAIGTTAAFQSIGGNNSRGTVTITATAPNLNIGSYQLYAVFTPTTPPNYGPGTSADVPLTVTAPQVPTSTSISCTGGLFGGTCTSTTKVTATGVPVSTGNTVNFSGTGGIGSGTETTNAAGQASWNFAAFIGDFTVTASFPAQGTYGASSNSTGVICFIFCGFDRTGSGFNLANPFDLAFPQQNFGNSFGIGSQQGNGHNSNQSSSHGNSNFMPFRLF